METNEQRPVPPTPEEAAAALASVDEARRGLVERSTPVWYVAVLSGVVAAVALSNLLPGLWGAVVCVLLAAFCGGLASRQVRRQGFQTRMGVRDIAVTCVLGGLVVAGFIIDDRLGLPGVWWVVAAVSVLVMAGWLLLPRLVRRGRA
ncbi:hypothetical protein [Nocardiopsis trehalosi]|uniref:hypothetical protein n=1 Tax=Nocardiopsis trehalosi TaxID=109329 RepID=UPI0008337762|nr:hypothetical protein [Nocardiopsis trehalosi]